MSEFNGSLREWQPLMQFIQLLAVIVLTGIVGIIRLWEQVKQRRLDEEQAEKDGLDPDKAESR